MIHRHLLCSIVFLALATWSIPAAPLGTAFTYQGRLNSGAQSAQGIYDLHFTLYDAATGGGTVGAALTSAGTPVANGLFTLALDFGAGAFDGNARWMQIAVRTNGAATFSPLTPRQALTASPHALYAPVAGQASRVPNGAITSAMLANGAVGSAQLAPGAVTQLGTPGGGLTNAVQVGTNGLIGIGTTTPQAGLDVHASGTAIVPSVLYQVENQTQSYQNLSGAFTLAASSNLVVIGALNGNAVTVVDVSSPGSPVLQSQFSKADAPFTNLTRVVSVALSGQLLAVASMTDHAVTLISLTNPASPVKLAELRDGLGGWNDLLSARAVAFSGNLLAIAGEGDNAVTLADVSNPSAPVLRSVLKQDYGYTNLLQPDSLAFSGNLLAIGAFGSSAVTLVDVSNPASVIKRGEMRNGQGSFTNLFRVLDVKFSGNLLAIAARDANAVTLVNVSNPAVPVWQSVLVDGIGGITTLAGAKQLAWSGHLLAVAGDYENAVTLFDVSAPTRPRMLAAARQGVGGFDFLSGPSGLAYVGTNLAVAASGSSAFTLLAMTPQSVGVLSQGWVGIGTESPVAPLHVVGNVFVEQAARFSVDAERVELGNSARAPGARATAIGGGAVASGAYSVAIGYQAKASGNSAYAFGEYAIASGSHSTALGYATEARGTYSTALGNHTLAAGSSSMAAGYYAQAEHDRTFVWNDATASYFASTAPDQFLIHAIGGMGINTNNPSGAALNVAGTVRASAFQGDGAGLTGVSVSGSSITSGTIDDARLSANVARRSGGNTFTGAQVISTGSLRMNDLEIYLRGGSDAFHGLGWYGGGKLFAEKNLDGPVLYGNTRGGLGTTTSDGQRLALIWDGNGNVGIDPETLNAGGMSPGLQFGGVGSGEGLASKRTAGGNQYGLDFYTSFANRLSILNTGMVGLGTTNPTHQLHINSPGTNTVRLTGPGSAGSGAKLNFGDAEYVYLHEVTDDVLRVQANRMGVGRTPALHRLEVEGEASKTTATGWLANSDARIKKDIATVTNALETLSRVHPVSFRYTDEYRAAHPSIEDRPYVNVVAQEFREVFPDAVKSSGETLADGSEILQVDTYPITIYSAAAIQELSAQVKVRDAEIQALKARVATLDGLERRLVELEQLLRSRP